MGGTVASVGMQFIHLTYFDALAREEHFGRAAHACFVSASTLSQAMRKFEAEVGFPLVRRGRASYQGLTAEGEVVLNYARRILAEQRSLEQDMASRHGTLEGTLRFGTIPAGTEQAATLIAHLTELHPGVKVELIGGLTSEQISSQILNHDLDAGIVHPAEASGSGAAPEAGALHQARLGRTSWAVCGHPEVFGTSGTDSGAITSTTTNATTSTAANVDTINTSSAASSTATITGAELAELPLALLRHGTVARREFDRAHAGAGLSVTPGVEASSVELLKAMAATGRWLAVVPEHTAPASRWEARRLVEPEVYLELAVARLESRPLPAMSAALDDAIAVMLAAGNDTDVSEGGAQ